MEKEYNIRLIVEFKGKSIGETRQEAMEDIDIPDFIDEALHDERYKIKKVIPQLSMRTILLPVEGCVICGNCHELKKKGTKNAQE